MGQLFTKAEACVLLHISPRTLDRYLRAGKGPIQTKVGRKILFTDRHLGEFMESCAVPLSKKDAAA